MALFVFVIAQFDKTGSAGAFTRYTMLRARTACDVNLNGVHTARC